MQVRAACCCQACTITVAGAPTVNALCHCNNCKRRSGSAFGWSTYFAEADVRDIQGDFTPYVLTTIPATRFFCAACGTTLYWKVDSLPGFIGIAGGCFEADALGPPAGSHHDTTRCAWLALPDKIPALS